MSKRFFLVIVLLCLLTGYSAHCHFSDETLSLLPPGYFEKSG
jgi:hypothetical protein